MTIEAATEAYISRIDDSAFCKRVGVMQEVLLRTTHKDDLDGAFAAAVTDQLAA